jgi:hypothetical protein
LYKLVRPLPKTARKSRETDRQTVRQTFTHKKKYTRKTHLGVIVQARQPTAQDSEEEAFLQERLENALVTRIPSEM